MDETMIRTWTPESEQPSPGPVVDYHTVKAWFQQCRDKTAAIRAQRQKLQRIRDIAEKTTPSLSGMPGGSGAGDKIGGAAGDIVDEERRLQQMETDLHNLRIEATRRAYCLTSSRQADCICRFYVDGKSLKTIADEDGVSSESNVFQNIRLGCTYLAEMRDDWQIAKPAQEKR